MFATWTFISIGRRVTQETLLQRPTIFKMSHKGLAGRNLIIVGPLPWNRLGPKILMGTEKNTYDILKTNS